MELASLYDVEHLLVVANTRHGPEGHVPFRPGQTWDDHLQSAEEALAYFDRQGLAVPPEPVGEAELTELRRLRRAVRALAEDGDARAYQEEMERLRRRFRFRLDGQGRLVPEAEGWDRLVGGMVLPLMELGGLSSQLKLCHNPDCRWVFVDRSKNHSRRWCEMGTCGNRAKVRRYRRRQARAG